MRSRFAFLAVLLVPFLSACVVRDRAAGVSNTWRRGELEFEVGESTEQDVMDRLGPPSQVIDLGGRTVFYYLHERLEGSGLILILYNRNQEDIRYDRAIFFFDPEGVLQAWKTSEEAFPYVDEGKEAEGADDEEEAGAVDAADG